MIFREDEVGIFQATSCGRDYGAIVPKCNYSIANFLGMWVLGVYKNCDHANKKRLAALSLFICVVVSLILSGECGSLNA